MMEVEMVMVEVAMVMVEVAIVMAEVAMLMVEAATTACLFSLYFCFKIFDNFTELITHFTLKP